ncbi:hypothetical protein F5880DRAFT_1511813 [Lentinula raphanica]|nr:hypothetical protein F5880DRAFT_1511813 [Lentinula raphanica]
MPMPNVIILQPPSCSYKTAEILQSEDELSLSQLLKVTVLRHKIMLYDDAPHGFYIAPVKSEGDPYLFKFINGNNALKAYHEAVQSPMNSNISKHTRKPDHLHLSTGNQMNQWFNPLPMRTGISIREDIPKAAQEAYYYLSATTDTDFQLIQEVQIVSSWLFAMNFEYIQYQIIPSPTGGEPQRRSEIVAGWPKRLWPTETGLNWPKMVYLPNINNWSTVQSDLEYGDSHVVVKRSPRHTGVSVTLFGWDWHKQKASEDGFKIYHGFDFVVAANEQIVCEGYDGNIGLAPRMERLTNLSMEVSTFIIRLVHPDVLAKRDPWTCPLHNIISFGSEFPLKAPVNPDAQFSAPIPTTSPVIGRPESWRVKLLRIGIVTAGSDDYAWINMDDPTSSRGNQGIDIYMDTGSPMSIFPGHVVTKMLVDKHWLGSSRGTVSDYRRPSIAPEIYEDLASKYILFQFQGADSHAVEVKVQARIFLSWYPTLERNNEYIYYRTIKATKGDLYVLGQNWYWAAIVKHAIPVETHFAPYVQVMPNGYFYDIVARRPVIPEDMENNTASMIYTMKTFKASTKTMNLIEDPALILVGFEKVQRDTLPRDNSCMGLSMICTGMKDTKFDGYKLDVLEHGVKTTKQYVYTKNEDLEG